MQTDRVRTGCAFMSSCDMRLHFGLGAREKVDSLEIHWPSGQVDKLANVKADRVVVIQEGGKELASPYKPLRHR